MVVFSKKKKEKKTRLHEPTTHVPTTAQTNIGYLVHVFHPTPAWGLGTTSVLDLCSNATAPPWSATRPPVLLWCGTAIQWRPHHRPFCVSSCFVGVVPLFSFFRRPTCVWKTNPRPSTDAFPNNFECVRRRAALNIPNLSGCCSNGPTKNKKKKQK